jgi:hypothetical protein
MKKPKKYVDEDQLKKYLVSGLTMLSAIVVRRLIEYLWKAATDEEPPKNPASRKVEWQEAFLFTMLTGLLVSMTKLFIRRNVAVELEEEFF